MFIKVEIEKLLDSNITCSFFPSFCLVQDRSPVRYFVCWSVSHGMKRYFEQAIRVCNLYQDVKVFSHKRKQANEIIISYIFYGTFN